MVPHRQKLTWTECGAHSHSPSNSVYWTDKHRFFQPAISWKVVQWEAMPREVHGVLQSTTLWYSGLYRLDQVCVWWKCYINCIYNSKEAPSVSIYSIRKHHQKVMLITQFTTLLHDAARDVSWSCLSAVWWRGQLKCVCSLESRKPAKIGFCVDNHLQLHIFHVQG